MYVLQFNIVMTYFTDIDECSSTQSPCSHDAVCTNTIGDFICNCTEGFDGDGYYCTGIFIPAFVSDKTFCKASTN